MILKQESPRRGSEFTCAEAEEEKMKAVRIHELGGPEVLRVEDVPIPEPGRGQARVRLVASGVNFIDTYQRSGQYRLTLPAILGQEGAGVVDAIGPDVSDVHVGDPVAFANVMGSYAEYVVAPAWQLVPVPTDFEAKTAAAAMLQGMTAHYLTHATYPLKPGDSALVHAAAGGVGNLLVQMAKQKGARVIAAVSTGVKAKIARALAADEVIVHAQTDFESEVKRLTSGRGVQVVYDSVGKDTFEKSLNCLALRGLMVLYGQSSGAVPPVDPQLLNAKGSLFLTRPALQHHVHTREELLGRATDVLSLIQSGMLRLRIDREFPLGQAADAHRYLHSRLATGKILLTC
jgi:NADPH2:quinone reductase